jgi:hypothetical protein
MTEGSSRRRRAPSQTSQAAAQDEAARSVGHEGHGGDYPHEHPVLVEALAMLATRLAEVASYNAVGEALQYGFQTLAEELAPLRQLVPPSVPKLDARVAETMLQVQVAMIRPKWDGVTTLTQLDTEGTRPIGDPGI